MQAPPFNARSPGVLFDGTSFIASQAETASSRDEVDRSSADQGRLFEFESELEATLTYIPMAVRFKLDKCGVKLSLGAWQQLSEDTRRELFHAPCDRARDIASYRQLLRSSVAERIGAEPACIPIAQHPPWADKNIPEQITKAAMALNLPPLSAASWSTLTPLQRFALVKLSQEGREHRNLGAALREFGLL